MTGADAVISPTGAQEGAKPSDGVDPHRARPGAGVRCHPWVPLARDPPRAPAWKPELWSFRGSGPGLALGGSGNTNVPENSTVGTSH